MSSEYAVRIAALRTTASTAESAADQIHPLRPVDGLRPAGAAIPGSRSAALLSSVGSRWAERLTSLEADFRRHANALKVAATQYEVNDAEAAAAFDASYAGSLSSWAYR